MGLARAGCVTFIPLRPLNASSWFVGLSKQTPGLLVLSGVTGLEACSPGSRWGVGAREEEAGAEAGESEGLGKALWRRGGVREGRG